MKAMLFNNIATCYFHLDDLEKADHLNDLALIEEPDYAKALLRKGLILERRGDFQQAFSIARFAINRFDSVFEDERNQKVVPSLKELRDRCEGKADG
jgi:tetratricopeptide (TPR) repeat protein